MQISVINSNNAIFIRNKFACSRNILCMLFDLKRFRIEKKISQKQLADKLGVGQSFISQIENGKNPIPDLLLSKLKDIYALDIRDYQADSSLGGCIPVSAGERLEKIIKEHYKMSPYAFSQKYNDRGGVKTSQVIRGRNGLSSRLLNLIIQAYPEINRVWLLTGEGPMLKTEPKSPISDKESINLKNDDEMTNNMLVTMLYDANQRIKRLEAEIEELKQQQGDATDSQKKRGAI